MNFVLGRCNVLEKTSCGKDGRHALLYEENVVFLYCNTSLLSVTLMH